MTETIATVLKKIKADLDWRGPNDRVLAHVILSREQGEHLHRVVLDIIMERDALLFEQIHRTDRNDWETLAIQWAKDNEPDKETGT